MYFLIFLYSLLESSTALLQESFLFGAPCARCRIENFVWTFSSMSLLQSRFQNMKFSEDVPGMQVFWELLAMRDVWSTEIRP